MHIAGVVFMVINLILAIASLYIGGFYVSARNSWLQQVEKSEKEYLENKIKLAEAEYSYRNSRNDLDREKLGWGRHWENVEVRVIDKAKGQLSANNLGTNQKLVKSKDADGFTELEGFMPFEEGYMYIGTFEVNNVDGDRSELILKQTPRPEDANLLVNGNWRFREQVPAGQITPFSTLAVRFAEADEQLQERNVNLKKQQKSVEDAKKLREQRYKELDGDAQAPEESGPVIVDGIVETIRKEALSRNKELRELDELRQQLDQINKEFTRLKTENEALVEAKKGAANVAQGSDNSAK